MSFVFNRGVGIRNQEVCWTGLLQPPASCIHPEGCEAMSSEDGKLTPKCKGELWPNLSHEFEPWRRYTEDLILRLKWGLQSLRIWSSVYDLQVKAVILIWGLWSPRIRSSVYHLVVKTVILIWGLRSPRIRSSVYHLVLAKAVILIWGFVILKWG